MDVEWFKTALATVATHGPWALFCWWLANKLAQQGQETTSALVANAAALAALKTHIESTQGKIKEIQL